MGLLFAAAGVTSVVVGILCMTPGEPHIPASGGEFYGLGIFLIFLGICLVIVSLNDMLKVPWHNILPDCFFDSCYACERLLWPSLHKSDTGIMACLLAMIFAAVVLLILGIVMAVCVPPFSHRRDLWVGIVFIVVAFTVSLWVALMCTVIRGPFAEAPGSDAAPAGGYALQRAGPYSEPAGAPYEAPAGIDQV